MYFYKVLNFTNVLGTPDWKGLDKAKNIKGSQLYYENEAILANEEKVIHADLVELTEQEYLNIRTNWLQLFNVDGIEQRVTDLELAYADLTGGAV